MVSVIADWPSDQVSRFEKDIIQFRHNLHERLSFADEDLVDLLDRYPRGSLGVFTMGRDLEDWRGWRRGVAQDLTGRQLLEAVREGRLWLNLRHTNKHLPDFADLCNEIAAEKERHFGVRILNRDLGVLISSPHAQVFYHLDVPYSSLWHLRGEKRISFYPREEPFVDPAWLERCVRRRAEGQMPFSADWESQARSMLLRPGDMVTWPQNMPHRVDNGPMLNVSMSMEFMTPAARTRANVLYANGVLRDLGIRPRIQPAPAPIVGAKLMLALTHKALRLGRPAAPVLPETFTVDTPPTLAA